MKLKFNIKIYNIKDIILIFLFNETTCKILLLSSQNLLRAYKKCDNKKRRNATKPGFQRFNKVLIWQE